ncbi:Dynein regulatory complex subunit 6 [Boothiomyces sp. JEL0838]|nr:Dynein regulatory complex subunit 6 [Boothiomyces sp. JEL0838]
MNCPNMLEIDFRNCKNLTDYHLEILNMRPKSLAFASCRNIGDSGIFHLVRNCGSFIEKLCIENCCQLTDQSLIRISQYCVNLRYLKLSQLGSNITDDGLLAIAGIHFEKTDNHLKSNALPLEVLQLYDCPMISDYSLIEIAQNCNHLFFIDFYHLPMVTDQALIAFARYSNLATISLSELKRITDQSICEIGRCCDITSLTICHNEQITDRGMIELVRLSPNLRLIDISLVGDITLVSLIATVQCCKLLKHVVVSGNLSHECIPTRAILDVVKHVSSLQTLSVFQSQDMTLEDITDLESVCPKLQHLFVRNCVEITMCMAQIFSKTHRLQLITEG